MGTERATPRAVAAAGEIYARWEAERADSPLDRVVAAEFRSRHYLNSAERRWVASALYGTARFLRRQERLLETLGLPVTAANLIQIWAEAPVLPEGTSPSDAPVERLLPVASERLAAAISALPGPDSPHDDLRITLSFPDAMADALEDLLGGEALDAARAFNRQAPTTLRVNTLRASRQRVRAALPEAAPTRYSPWGVELPQRANLHDLPGFRAGWFEAQEEGSQLVALLTDARPDQTVIDASAGAGGKTLALAALMQGRGRLIALDTSEARLRELEKRAARAKASHIETLRLKADAEGHWQLTGAARQRLNHLRATAEVVLVDAPCTGSGVLRRSPDAKWRIWDQEAFARLQQTLLAQASTLVALGGTLCYATCAFERSQNEAVIEAFLASSEGGAFRIEPALPRLRAACERAASLASPSRSSPGASAQQRSAALSIEKDSAATTAALSDFDLLAAGPYLRTWPHRHGLDAFFAACLRRQT